MLGAAEADAPCAEGVRGRCLVGLIGIRPDAEPADLVGPPQQLGEPGIDVRLALAQLAGQHLQNLARPSGHAADLHLPRQPVERDVVALLEALPVDGHDPPRFGNLQLARPDHRRLAHLAADHRRVRGHAAGSRQHALRHVHAVDVVRHRLLADQQHVAALPGPADRLVGGEDHLAAGRPGRRRQTAGHRRQRGPGLRVEDRGQQLGQRVRIDHAHRVLRFDHLLGDEVGGDDHRGAPGALSVARLQHVQLLVLDGELEVLHVPVVLLQALGDSTKLLVGARHHLLELADRLRRANARHHVLALRVDQELAVELVRPGGRVAGEADAGAGALAGVAEHHRLHVDRRPDGVRDVVDAAVLLRARVLPRAEHRVAGHPELAPRIQRERFAALADDHRLEPVDHLAQGDLVELGVEVDAAVRLHPVELLLERLLGDLQHDVAEHLDEAAVAVEGEAAVGRARLQPLDRPIVEAEVQDGVHHAGHRELGTGTDGHQQGLLRRPQLRAGQLLQPAEMRIHLPVDGRGHAPPLLVVDGAGLGRHREPGRHRQPGVGHLRQVGALAPQQVAHRAVSLGGTVAEEIDELRLGRGLLRGRLAGGPGGLALVRRRLLGHAYGSDYICLERLPMVDGASGYSSLNLRVRSGAATSRKRR